MHHTCSVDHNLFLDLAVSGFRFHVSAIIALSSILSLPLVGKLQDKCAAECNINHVEFTK
jgi:hypothetical protein